MLRLRKKTIVFLLCAMAIVFLPLLWYPYAYYAFEQFQALWLRFFAVAAIAVAIYLILHSGSIRYPKLSRLVLAFIGVFCLAVFFSTVFSWSPLVSFWGSHYRFQGIISVLSYTLLGIAVYSLFVEEDSTLTIENLYRWIYVPIIVSGIMVSMYGVVQRIWGDPWFHPFRVHASFGHPNFLASYISITIIAAITLLFSVYFESYKWKILLCGGLVIEFIALFLTLTRTAWISMVIGVGVVIIIHLFIVQKNTDYSLLRYFSTIILIVFLVSSSFMFARYINANANIEYTASQSTAALPFVLEEAAEETIESNPLDHRLKSIFSPSEGSGSVRLYIWKDSLDIIKDNWLFGVGNDAMHIRYPEYYRGEAGRPYIARSTYADRAHNDILDSWIAYGIFGVISKYVLIVIILSTALFWIKQNVTTHRSNAMSIIITFIASSISLLAFVQLGFGTIATNTIMVLLVAISAAILFPVRKYTVSLPPPPKTFQVFYVLFIVIILFRIVVQPAWASILAFDYRSSTATNEEVVSQLIVASRLDMTIPEYDLLLSDIYLQSGIQATNRDDKQLFFELANEHAVTAYKKGIIRLEYWDTMIAIYDAWAFIEPSKLEQKHVFEEKIWSKVPHFGDLHIQYENE